MKRLVFLLLIVVLFLVGCKGKVSIYDEHNIDDFDQLILDKMAGLYNQALAWDVRENCEEGRIEGFVCIRAAFPEGIETNELIDMILMYNKNALILLICSQGVQTKEIADILINEKYTNVHYFSGGYTNYISIKGEDFIPYDGCDC